MESNTTETFTIEIIEEKNVQNIEAHVILDIWGLNI